MFNMEYQVCENEFLFIFILNLIVGVIIYWYDVLIGGNLLYVDSSSYYIFVVLGNYFVEVWQAIIGCINL